MGIPPHQLPIFKSKPMRSKRPIMATAEMVMSALRLRYPAESHALLEQVANATGAHHSRWADAIIMGLWPSRGLEVIGIEVKVRRADWLDELNNPGKADPIAKYCDRWFLVVGDENIVHEGELPVTWGLLVPRDEKQLRCVKDAPLLKDHAPLDKPFIAAILRSAQAQMTPAAKMRLEYKRGHDEGLAQGRSEVNFNASQLQDKFDRLQKHVAEYEKASGLTIANGWNLGNLGEAVRQVLSGDHMRVHDNLRTTRNRVAALLDSIDQILAVPASAKPAAANGKEAPCHL